MCMCVRERKRVRERKKERDGEKKRERDRQTDRETDRERQRDRDRDRNRDRDRERERHRQTETERDKQTDRGTEREREIFVDHKFEIRSIKLYERCADVLIATINSSVLLYTPLLYLCLFSNCNRILTSALRAWQFETECFTDTITNMEGKAEMS